MMTMKDLEQLRGLKGYIETLEDEIRELSMEHMTTDTVTGSMTEYPYTKHSIVIGGLDKTAGDDRRLKEKLLALYQAKEKAHERYLEAFDFVEQIQDPLVKQVIILKYMSGAKKTWQQVANILGCCYSGDYLRKTVERALKKSERL